MTPSSKKIVVDLVLASRAAQGLSPSVTDSAALAKVAALVDGQKETAPARGSSKTTSPLEAKSNGYLNRTD